MYFTLPIFLFFIEVDTHWWIGPDIARKSGTKFQQLKKELAFVSNKLDPGINEMENSMEMMLIQSVNCIYKAYTPEQVQCVP